MPAAIIPRPIRGSLIRKHVFDGYGDRAFVRPRMIFFHSAGQETFWFPYAPREVSYSQLAAEYNEIRRPGAFPIIERTAPQLMQVSMEFRVAEPSTNGMTPVEARLDQLRFMALWPGFVLVTDMDAFLSRPKIPTQVWQGAKFAKFLLTDLSIDIIQRDLNNYATQADVRLTLTEDRNPFVFTTTLPRIEYNEEPQRQTGGSTPPDPDRPNPFGERGKYSDGLSQQILPTGR